jgi:hypothetical protein
MAESNKALPDSLPYKLKKGRGENFTTNEAGSP